MVLTISNIRFHIRFIRNNANPYSVYKKPNPNTANPYSAYKKTNPNSFISYSVYKERNYSVPYIFGFGRIIRIRLIPNRREYLFFKIVWIRNSLQTPSEIKRINLLFWYFLIQIGMVYVYLRIFLLSFWPFWIKFSLFWRKNDI